MRSKLLFQQKMGALMGIMLVLLCTLVKAQTIRSSASPLEKTYNAQMAKQPIKVDGKLNEKLVEIDEHLYKNEFD